MKHAVSTVAMSIYNYTARSGRLVSTHRLEELRAHLAREQHRDLDLATVQAAVAQLTERGLLVPRFDGLDVADAARRIVVTRDRSDGVENEDGTILGGWNGWTVLDLTRGQIPMTEVR